MLTTLKKLQDNAIDWKTKIKEAENTYHFQPELTEKLDNHKVTLQKQQCWK
jgi:hypothetical protein